MGLIGKRQAKVGVLTKLRCGSDETRYVSQLARSFGQSEIDLVLFTDFGSTDSLRKIPVQSSVEADSSWGGLSDDKNIRCWNLQSSNYSALEQAVKNAHVDVLHVTAPLSSFEPLAFQSLLAKLKLSGVRLVLDCAQADFVSADVALVAQVDRVVVTSAQQRLETIAFGFPPSNVATLGSRLGQSVAKTSGFEARRILQIPESNADTATKVVLILCGLGSEAVSQDIARSLASTTATTVIVAPYELDDQSGGHSYRGEQWIQVAKSLESLPSVRVLSEGLKWEELPKFLGAATVVVFSGASLQGRGAEYIAAAINAGCPVVAPNAEPFLGYEGRAFYSGKRNSLLQATAALVASPTLTEELSKLAVTAPSATDSDVKDRFTGVASIYLSLVSQKPKAGFEVPVGRQDSSSNAVKVSSRAPRILMQHRENAYTHPGGDTVVMDRVSEGLRARGVTVDIDLKGERNPKDYDLVHLFNFALKDQTEKLAKRCQQLGVPYVVTTMYEDWPIFFNQMGALTTALDAYVGAGQPLAKWPEFEQQARLARPSPIWDNSLTANFASALIATGANEAASLKRDYPGCKRVETYYCGSDCPSNGDGGELFRKETGLSDFVLCVGRFELRKNQLMLLKALEQSDLTLVFAGGGFSYQPQYLEVCKRFKRKGKTVFLDRLDGKMLVSAYEAAKVHVLPSWFELPGIVSLEAASLGTNVVVTEYGTARDYFGDMAYYCRPDEPESIGNAVTAAFYANPKAGLKDRARRFTWDGAAVRNGEIYRTVLADRRDLDWSCLTESRLVTPTPTERASLTVESVKDVVTQASRTVEQLPQLVVSPATRLRDAEDATKLCNEADLHQRKGELGECREKCETARRLAPNLPRPSRGLGVLALNEKQYSDAEVHFKRALAVDPNDSKSAIGLGMVRWGLGDKHQAFELYIACARANPSDSTVLLHLVGAAYELNRLEDLEMALRAFLKSDQDNTNILYCLAGCCYRRGRSAMALGVLDRVLKLAPEHGQAQELKDKIDKELQEAASAASETKVASSTMTPAAEALQHLASLSSIKIGGLAAPAASTAAPTVRGSGKLNLTSKLDEIEGMKKARKHDEMLRAVESYLGSTDLTPSERSHGKILKAEALACLSQLVEADALFAECESDSALGYRALSGRGVVCAAAERWDDAERYFNRAIERNSNADVALAGLGLVAISHGQKERAWDFFQRALAVNPENLRALFGVIELGYVLQKLPETAKALETYLDYRPIDLAINYAYAGCCYALGRREQALQECQKILLLDANYEMALELVKKIESEGRAAVNAR